MSARQDSIRPRKPVRSTKPVRVRLECEERLLRRMLHVAIRSSVAMTANEERAIVEEFLRIVRRAEHFQVRPLSVHPYHQTEE